MFGVLSIDHSIEVLDNHSQVVASIFGLFEQVFNAHVKHLDCFVAIASDSQFVCDWLEGDLLD